MKRRRATTSCAAINASRAADPVSHEVPDAVAVRPTMAPTATAVIQSNGVNSAMVRRSVVTTEKGQADQAAEIPIGLRHLRFETEHHGARRDQAPGRQQS